jgi:hypothetical protein
LSADTSEANAEFAQPETYSASPKQSSKAINKEAGKVRTYTGFFLMNNITYCLIILYL